MMNSTLAILVLCALVLGVLAIIVAGVVAFRYLSYRETLALAEKGLVRPAEKSGADSKTALRWGIVLVALGIALLLGLVGLGLGGNADYPFGLGPWSLFGLIPLFFGLALILIAVLTGSNGNGKKPAEPNVPQVYSDQPDRRLEE